MEEKIEINESELIDKNVHQAIKLEEDPGASKDIRERPKEPQAGIDKSITTTIELTSANIFPFSLFVGLIFSSIDKIIANKGQ